jgi:hypothetical protein
VSGSRPSHLSKPMAAPLLSWRKLAGRLAEMQPTRAT